ncbi:hypothetical protein AUP68_04777 [Ilyonectria robusta]
MLPHSVHSFQLSPPQTTTPPNSPLLPKPTDAKNSVTSNGRLGLHGNDAESSLAERLFMALEKFVDERPPSDNLFSGSKAPTEAKKT